MPVLRDPVINLRAIHKRPTIFVEAAGNPIANGPDTPVTTTKPDGRCTVGVIPSTLNRTPYVVLRGGQDGDVNLRHWLIAIYGAPTVTEGDLIDVQTGESAGRYRAQLVNPTPPGERIVLAQCLKET